MCVGGCNGVWGEHAMSKPTHSDNRYLDYKPIQTLDLPAKWFGIFKLVDTTFTPANDYDRVTNINGHSLQLVTNGDDNGKRKTLSMAAGYQVAIWELREGHLRYCPSQDRLWRRDADDTDHEGPRLTLNSWHPVKTIEDEYHVGTNANSNDRDPRVSATILREAKRAQWFDQVERGLRVDPCVWIRRDGHVVELRDGADDDIAVTQTFDPKGMSNQAIDQAERIIRWLTADEKSYRNLLRMFATPWLEPFKQLTYVLSGHGGDGKSLIMRCVQMALGDAKCYPAFKISQYCSKTYGLAMESMNDAMGGKAFAYDDEAPEVTDSMLPALRALSTGSQLQARVTKGKYYMMTPTATIVLCTNMPFADSTENSDRRRFVKVEMHPAEGRSYDEYHAIERFALTHPAAFFAASARFWMSAGDKPDDVDLMPARTLPDEMYWIITEILTNLEKCGQPIASRDAYREEFHKSVPVDTMSLLGLTNGTSSLLGGGQKRIVRVADADRFDKYRRIVEAEFSDGDAADDDTTMFTSLDELYATASGMPASVLQLGLVGWNADGPQWQSRIVDSMCEGRVGFAPCEGKRKGDRHDPKVSLSWKRLNPDDKHRTDASVINPGTKVYACVPQGQLFVIDCDENKQDPDMPNGFQLLQALVGGTYGGAALPWTLTSKTPHGVHLWYRMPDGFDMSRLLNAVHTDGIPIDLRVANKGYVVGPGSETDDGMYQLCSDDRIPPTVPEVTPQLLDVLERLYTDQSKTAAPVSSSKRRGPAKLSLGQVMAEPSATRRKGRPDMSPVPEGQRNDTLHAWAYGRAKNHPDNLAGIESDLYERGHASGLKDDELATIWKSIMRQVGHETAGVR